MDENAPRRPSQRPQQPGQLADKRDKRGQDNGESGNVQRPYEVNRKERKNRQHEEQSSTDNAMRIDGFEFTIAAKARAGDVTPVSLRADQRGQEDREKQNGQAGAARRTGDGAASPAISRSPASSSAAETVRARIGLTEAGVMPYAVICPANLAGASALGIPAVSRTTPASSAEAPAICWKAVLSTIDPTLPAANKAAGRWRFGARIGPPIPSSRSLIGAASPAPEILPSVFPRDPGPALS